MSSPKAPANPYDGYQEAAQGAVETALAGQQDIMNYFAETSGQYLEDAAGVVESIAMLTGRSPAEAVQLYEQRFDKGIKNINKEGKKRISRDRPKDIIRSKSTRAFDDYLNAAMNDYTDRMDRVSSRASQRLKEMPGLVMDTYSQAASNPAYNLLKDADMKSAIQNPWVNSELSKSATDAYRRAMTYNI